MANRAKEDILRRKAESRISRKQEVSLPQKNSPEDMEKLIHELQVHQIELEMQNDELRKAQEEVEESRSKYIDLYDFAPVGYFTLDNKGMILEANLTGAGLLGIERGLLLKTPFFLFIVADDQDLFRECQRKVFQIPGRQSCEVRLKRRNDDPFWVSLESVAVEDPDGKLKGVRVTLSDITERKRAEDTLKRSESRLHDLSSRLIQIQEMERKAISNEIHDGFLSELAAVKFSVEARISALKKGKNPGLSDLENILKVLEGTMKEARRIMNRLRPSIIDELGLIPAMNALCREFEEIYPHLELDCRFEIDEGDIPDPIKVVIFRVAQEAMTNSARHAKGTSTKMSLTKSPHQIEFMAQDNGNGFDLENTRKGVGLESMRERVEISGGKFQIESTIGQGTTIRATWSSTWSI